jgi:predicted ATP-grasp superfamily ATP-dependent carboligase
LKVLVYEHVCGGGYAGKPIPVGVLSEGFAMLRCVVADFRSTGHEVTVLLDERLAKFNPPIGANYTIQILYADEPQKLLYNAAQRNDAVYVIAPETGQALQTFVRLAEKTGITSLNSKSEAIKEIADKARLYESLQKKGFLSPKTLIQNTADNPANIKQTIDAELKYPVVFKPVDGTGCSGISLVESPVGIEKAVAKIVAESSDTRFIIQEFVNGQSVSVSLVSNGNKAVALSLNSQQITLAQPHKASSYDGGCVPFEHPIGKDALALAERLIESFSDLRGYVGVDLILAKNHIYVIDINARLTTSYVGLRQVAGFNLAQTIIDTTVTGKISDKNHLIGVACFQKIQTSTPTTGAYRRALKVSGVISPPFPLIGYTESVALIMGYGDSLADAQLGLEEAKKSLCSIIG